VADYCCKVTTASVEVHERKFKIKNRKKLQYHLSKVYSCKSMHYELTLCMPHPLYYVYVELHKNIALAVAAKLHLLYWLV